MGRPVTAEIDSAPPPPRIAVELGKYESRDCDPAGKRFGYAYSFLTRHRVEHQQGLVWVHLLGQVAEFLHEGVVNLLPARRIDDCPVCTGLNGPGDTGHSHVDWSIGASVVIDLHTQLASQ